jgi:hypothetical protein
MRPNVMTYVQLIFSGIFVSLSVSDYHWTISQRSRCSPPSLVITLPIGVVALDHIESRVLVSLPL